VQEKEITLQQSSKKRQHRPLGEIPEAKQCCEKRMQPSSLELHQQHGFGS